jgi:hypothetical protein
MRAFEIIGTGLLFMFICTVIHALMMVFVNRVLEWRMAHLGSTGGEFHRSVLVSLLTLCMFVAIVIEAWIWALLYLYNPFITALPDLETAFYFSMVTFTTLGYGDVTLTGEWRTLASIQAANGVIVFGWTTALIFYFIQRIYKSK